MLRKLDSSDLALNTATLGHILDGHGAGWSPSQVIDACAARGFGGITWWRRELGDQALQIGEQTRAAGLRVSGLCRAPFLVGPGSAATRSAVVDDMRVAIDQCAALGAESLTVVVGGVVEQSRGVQPSLDQLTDILAATVTHADQCDVRLGLEPLHPVYAGNRSCLVSVRDTIDILQQIAAPALGIAVDVYHVWWDTSLDSQLQRLDATAIFGLHICDWLADTGDILLDRGMMGDGVADIPAIRAAVEGRGYQGLCEVEIFSANDWWKRPPDEVLDTALARFVSCC